jgi:hypothetical protein
MFVSTLRAAVYSASAALLITSIAATFGWSHDSNHDSALRDRDAAAAKFVAQRLQIWQDRMDLKDWNIQVQLLRADQLEPKTLGNIHWDTDTKQATIGVLSPEDYKLPPQAMLDDMEFTIVHELVHLELASLPRSEASRRIEERAVNELANALLKLARHS